MSLPLVGGCTARRHISAYFFFSSIFFVIQNALRQRGAWPWKPGYVLNYFFRLINRVWAGCGSRNQYSIQLGEIDFCFFIYTSQYWWLREAWKDYIEMNGIVDGLILGKNLPVIDVKVEKSGWAEIRGQTTHPIRRINKKHNSRYGKFSWLWGISIFSPTEKKNWLNLIIWFILNN